MADVVFVLLLLSFEPENESQINVSRSDFHIKILTLNRKNRTGQGLDSLT